MKFFHCPLIHLITSTVYLSMIAFSMYSLLTGNKFSEAKANPNQILKKTVNKSLESPAMDRILMKYFKVQNNNNFCSLIDNKVSEAQANPNQKLKKTVNDASFESPVMDTVPNLLIGLKVPEARANPDQNLKKTVNTSFESSAIDLIIGLLIDNKVPEARANTNQNPKKTVNTSFESPDLNSLKLSGAGVNPNQKLKKIVDNTSFESSTVDLFLSRLFENKVSEALESSPMDLILGLLIDNKVSEARANPNKN